MNWLRSNVLKFLFWDIKTPLLALVGLAIFSSLVTIYALTNNPEIAGLIKGPEILQREEDALIAEVRQIIDLPEGERPTVATVTEPEKLADQNFFKKAKEGDRILVYNEAGKAVLYRPSEKRVVELGNLNITNQDEAPENLENVEVQAFKLTIFNGTDIAGLTAQVEGIVLDAYPDAQVIQRSNASRTDYQNSLIIDFSNDRDLAQELADEFDLEITELPGGEVKPINTDFLIIAGANFPAP